MRRFAKFGTLAILGLVLMSLLAAPADAGGRLFGRRARAQAYAAAPCSARNGGVTQYQAFAYQAFARTTTTTATSDNALAAVNAVRAAYRLRPLAYDANLTNAAATNNAHQRSRGLGHFFNPGTWQCAGVGTHDGPQAANLWLNSPAHRAILLDPNLTTGGCSVSGGCATLNCR